MAYTRATCLLVLDGLGELVAEREVGDGDVVHDEVELLRPVGQLVPDARAHGLTLAQQLLGVVLGHDCLQHLRAAERMQKKMCGAKLLRHAKDKV